MPKFRVSIQQEPFDRTVTRTLFVEADSVADAYLTVYDRMRLKGGMALNTTEPFTNLCRWFSEETRESLAASGLPCNGYPAITHIVDIERLPETSLGRGRVISEG